MAEVEEKGQVDKVVKDIVDGRREFTFEDGDEINHYFIADPTGEDIRKADWKYAKVFNTALVDEFPTQAQMIDILKDRGILSEEYTQKLDRAKIDLAAALFRLENMTDEMDRDEQRDLALETARLRDEFFRLNQKINGPMGNTCEELATDARNEYLTSRVIQKKNGERIWKTHDDYLNESNNALILKCRFEVMAWLSGVESNFIEKMPEQVVMRRIAEEELNSRIAAFNKAKLEDKKETEDLQLPEQIEETNPAVKETKTRAKARPRGRPRKSSKKSS